MNWLALLKNEIENAEIDSGFITKVAATSLCGLVLVYLGKVWNSYRVFKKMGIKTPKYRFFFGNLPELRNNRNASEVLQKWTTELGKTYGCFEGHLPILVTSDLKLIEEIYVKKSSYFSARKPEPIGFSDDHPRKNLINATKSRWKRMRNIMNPTFSTSKLREMNPVLSKCSDRLIEKLDNEVGKEINISNYFKRFTMDSIWNCAFGLDIDTQNDIQNPYFVKSEEVFKNSADLILILKLAMYFGEFRSLITHIITIFGKYIKPLPQTWIYLRIFEIVEIRKRNLTATKYKDYIQLLLDAQSSDIKEVDKNEIDFSQIHVEKKLLDEEIKLNLMLFLFAGYETTSSTLSYVFYILATHPEEQQKLYESIIEQLPEGTEEEPNVDNVQKIVYLDYFIKEVLRMYPIANPVMTRRCMQPTTICGIEFPYDLSVQVDVLSIHYDQEIWGPVSVNEFYPLRFAPENKRNPLAYMGFGIGPRNCIGMKFALFELKTTIVKILKKFEILSSNRTPKVLELEEGIVRSPRNGVVITLKRRNKI